MQQTARDVPFGNVPRHTGHAHFWRRAMSRQRFLQSAAVVTGAAMAVGLSMPEVAAAQGSGPKPIPGGIQPLGPGTETFHIILPDHGTEPSTITDFNGVVGLAHVMGTGTGTDTTTGKTTPLLMDYDVRFMQGSYIGADGARHSGAFTFIWLDLYQGQVDPATFAHQVHDFNPGIAANGLFWTVPVSPASIQTNLSAGTGSLQVANQAMGDFIKVPSSLMHGPSVPATISYDVRWSGPGNPVSINDAKNGFAGEFLENTATVSASATRQGFQFVSDPAATSKSVFAVLGQERNGVFFSSPAQVPVQIPAAMPSTGAGGGAPSTRGWPGLIAAGGLLALGAIARHRGAGRADERTG